MSSSGEKIRTSAFSVFVKLQVEKYGKSEDSAAELWSSMSKRQKERYKAIAKDRNQGIGNKISIPIELQTSYMDKLIKAMEMTTSTMRSDIKELVNEAYELGNLDTKKFLILSINTFFEDAHDIHICEIAMAKFSLKKGIIKDLQVEICPGALPPGAECEALLKSSESHKYLLPSKHDKESDYIKVLLQIIDLLDHDADEDDGFPIIFTEGSTNRLPDKKLLINTQRAMVKIIEQTSEYKVASELKVYPISMLVYYLDQKFRREKQYAADNSESYRDINEAHVSFDFAMHDFEVTTEGCEYHNEMDAKKHCCLSKVRRYCYALVKLFANPLKYKLTEGRHYPEGYKPID